MELIGTIFCITLAAIVFAVLWIAIIVVVARTAQYIYEYFAKRRYEHIGLPLWQEITLGNDCDERRIPPTLALVRSKDSLGAYRRPRLGFFFESKTNCWELWLDGKVEQTFYSGDQVEVIWVNKFTTKRDKK